MDNSQFSISTYPLMKDSGVEWIGEIPEEWGVKKLKYVSDLKSGNNLVSEQFKPDGDFEILLCMIITIVIYLWSLL